MKNIYILGPSKSGKTAVGAGLALKLQQEGYRVSYFKPVGNAIGPGGKDEDGLLMKHLLNIDHSIDTIVPCIAGPAYLSGYRKKESVDRIMSAYEKIAQRADIVIIGGAGSPYILASFGMDSATLAEKLNAITVFLIRIENDFSLDQAIFYNKYFINKGITVAGNIFNNVPRPLLAKTEGVYRNILESRGLKTLGIIPVRANIASPTVAEYHEVLGGEILTGERHMDRLVEDVIIGAMTLDSALGYLRRAPNKAIITGGDRADIALAALETSTSALILTGGLYPDVKVIARAAEKKVPVILVHYDTYSTIEKINEVSKRIRPDDKLSIKVARENMETYCNWKYILDFARGE
jgi:hypothetical protein